MKRILLAVLSAALTLTAGMSTASAQDGVPQFRPVEMWACTFNDRKDQDDMDNVYDMIREGSSDSPYAAWQLNPYFVGTRIQQFDFLYLGAWASASDMGAGLASDLGSSDADEAWEDAVTCGGMMFASLRIQEAPQTGGAGDGFILTVQDCKTGKGVSSAQALSAIRAYNDYRVANGMTIPTFAWFPTAGDGDADFDFKLAHAYQDAQGWGNANQWLIDNMAYQTRSQLTDGIVDCDESRVYVGQTLMDNLNQ